VSFPDPAFPWKVTISLEHSLTSQRRNIYVTLEKFSKINSQKLNTIKTLQKQLTKAALLSNQYTTR